MTLAKKVHRILGKAIFGLVGVGTLYCGLVMVYAKLAGIDPTMPLHIFIDSAIMAVLGFVTLYAAIFKTECLFE